MAIYVNQDDLDQFNALRKMQRAFPNEASAFKARKKEWWARIHKQHGIPSSVKLIVGLTTGVLKDKATRKPWDPNTTASESSVTSRFGNW